MTLQHPRVPDMPQGDGWQINGTAKNADGTPMDLTGAVIEWAVVNNKGTTVARASLADYIAVVDAAAGKLVITLPSAFTAAIAAGQHQDYLRVTLPGGAPQTLWRGPFEVTFSPFKTG
ncbi:hypothetical protein [Rhodopseudomonas palustris]|uniref:hypothetical protein n=1 Tax=Rhodopseudomonas palustris TaxID=1076 RepID=UPI000CEBB214|nr:hypothetical protein [Rhodopseudomonas palustris]PPQ42185.1 hypothetical protein CKO39_18520 [Rhodopseudomonas palustris]